MRIIRSLVVLLLVLIVPTACASQRAGGSATCPDLDLLREMVSAVKGCRGLRKADMVNTAYCPKIEVDPETYEVRADGQLLTCEPARVLPMAQRYYLF